MKNILTQLDNGILTITINRPDKLNALNLDALSGIKAAIMDAYDNSDIRGVIITGAGEKAFIAGADISEFIGLSVEQGKEFSANGHEIFNLIENCPKPVIAALNGYVLGGGCELAMSCHIRVASENAQLGQPEVNLGIPPGYGGTQRLIQLIGKGKAFELLMTADMIKADEALSLGLVNHVTSSEELIPKCIEIIEKIKTKSPVAIKGVVKCVNAYFAEGVDGFKAEIDEFANCCGSEDFKEGIAAFLEKRKADFPGK